MHLWCEPGEMDLESQLCAPFSAVSLEAGESARLPSPSNFPPITLKAIETLASRLASPLSCKVCESVRYRANNIIFYIEFENGSHWECRVQKILPGASPLYYSARLKSTVATMRCIRRWSSIPIPEVVDWASKDPGPGLGADYIFMESLEQGGRTAKDCEARFVSWLEEGMDEDCEPWFESWGQERVYNTMATTTQQLASLQFPKIGRIYEPSRWEFVVGPFVDRNGESFGPFNTAVEYYQYKARKIRRKFHNWFASERRPHRPQEIKRADELCHLYDSVAGQLSDFDSGGNFPLVHGRFGMDSLLYPLEGSGLFAVINWDKAHTGPWLELAQYPAFLAIDWPRLAWGKYGRYELQSIKYEQEEYLKEFEEELES